MIAATCYARATEIAPEPPNRSWHHLTASLACGLECMGGSVVELPGGVNADASLDRRRTSATWFSP
jgi:hypothetical protein